jgi:hypothetical protein
LGWLEVRMVGPGWQCDSCRWRKVRQGSTRHEQKEYHRVHAASAERRRVDAVKFRRLLEAEAQEAARRAPEIERERARQELEAKELALAEVRERRRRQVEEAAQHKAAERRRHEAEEAADRARQEEAERKRGQIDAALISGLDPDRVARSVEGATEARVQARELELARLHKHRGKPWAEAALDAEIVRLTRAGIRRAVIVEQLGVGEHRVQRVREESGLKGLRFAYEDPTPPSAPPSPRVPNDPLMDDDRPARRRRPAAGGTEAAPDGTDEEQ